MNIIFSYDQLMKRRIIPRLAISKRNLLWQYCYSTENKNDDAKLGAKQA
jgi:hypothetical protein